MEAAVHPNSGRQSPGLSANSGLIATLTLLVGALALCFDRAYNGDVYLQLASGRLLSHRGLVSHDPFPTIAQGGQWLNQQWLTELTFFHTAGWVGMTGLTVLYAALLAAPLGMLLWLCRGKGRPMLVAIAVLYFPGMLAIVHPRAAGFSLLIFSALVVLIAVAWRRQDGDIHPRQWPVALAILALFALWANLHGGFVAGLLLIGLVSAGAAIDRWRGLPDSMSLPRAAVLGAIAVLAAITVTVATPLGEQIWPYLLSFRNKTLSLATEEWGTAFQSPLAVVYLGAASVFAFRIWLRSPPPRRATTLLVGAGFLVFAAMAIRNIVFVGPALAFVVAWSAPNRTSSLSLRIPMAVAGSVAVTTAIVSAVVLGPARADPKLHSPVVEYALAHPPAHGRILTYAGVGSYILWRSPGTPVVLDGWLEHFTPDQLRGNYGILRGWIADLPAATRRMQAGAVIAHLPEAISRLEADGFVAEFRSPEGTYLVRRGQIQPVTGRAALPPPDGAGRAG